ncbi:TetR/AcrR family transcriptional regulator, partial [Mesorhizobium sp. M7A.F.Ca.ET.027.03.2.1]
MATEPRRRPKQERSRERIDTILSTTMRLIGEKGIDAVTMKEVGMLAGGPIATVYHY